MHHRYVEITATTAALIARRRTEAGLTQAELAQQAGLSVDTVRGIESGRTERVRAETWHAIARVIRRAQT